MFKIAEEIMKKIETVLSVNEPALAAEGGIKIYNMCSGGCSGTCAGGCKGTCTASCTGNKR